MPALTPRRLRDLLGPVEPATVRDVEVIEEINCDGYTRQLVGYGSPSGRASAFVCIPTGGTDRMPLIYCHHQHAGQFELGKSEVVGLRGAKDQAYAAELAQRGFVTIAPDSIGFEDRNWAGASNIGWFELAARLVKGRTLLADELQEISLAIDYGLTLPQVDPSRIGFIGHSFGGRMALWAPAWDERIRASVSNCGCIPYRLSFSHDAGMQADFVVPDFASHYDLEDVLQLAPQCSYLVIAGTDDIWSRGASEMLDATKKRGLSNVTIRIRPGEHQFPQNDRELAYTFLRTHLG